MTKDTPNMMKKLLVAATVFSIHASAQAEGGYLGLGFGQANVTIDSADIAGTTETKDESANAYKAFVGLDLNRNFAVEVGYFSTGDVSHKISLAASSVERKVSTTAFFLDAVGRARLSDHLSALAKLGFASTNTKAKASATGIFAGCCSDESASETNMRYGLGVEFNPIQQVGFRIEFERTAKVGDPDTTGEFDVDFIGLGLALRF